MAQQSLTRDQMVSALRQAGWEDELIPWYLAVTKAESDWRPRALNDNPTTGDLSFGDGQINMIGELGVERRARYGITNEDLFDPVINARVARDILDSQGPGAWSVTHGGRIPFPDFDHRSSYQRPKVFNQSMTIEGQSLPGAAYGATKGIAVSPGDFSGVFDASFPGRDLPAYEDDPRFAAAQPFIAGVEKIFGTPEQRATLPAGLNATNNVPLAGDTRTIAIGKHLVDQGYTPWQHTNFDVNKGYSDQGGARVWQRPYESDHNTAEGALDFPLSHNTPEQLATLNNYLDQNREVLGVKQLIWGVPGHEDHLHVAFHPQVTRRRIS